ncbi:hypothetical protein JWJ90_13275 [Desulfobulbus rhabdoformis]|jgi:transposase-like protein|uniref:hypothetical protein n=1 Tax=Desulfobulbus rhabdoformis TaxID=34032 RepID=UPI0019628AD2|nr:hypothetical protein [Desulfobulbus rhabdoformis]MBM9615251.1 hypothetical protein [Desulfobulbus rhabdoformis]
MAESTSKVATRVIAKEIAVECPYCHEEQYGFVSDPRGGRFRCDDCHEEFAVVETAKVVIDA